MEIWDEEKAEVVLAEATKALAAPRDEPTAAERAAAGSLATMAVSWLRVGVERFSVRDEYTLMYEWVVEAAAPLLAFDDRDQIAALAATMPAPDVGFGWVEACERVVEEIEQPPRGVERPSGCSVTSTGSRLGRQNHKRLGGPGWPLSCSRRVWAGQLVPETRGRS